MLWVIIIEVSCILVALVLYALLRSDRWIKSPQDSVSHGSAQSEASDFLPLEINDNGGRRSGIDRRGFSDNIQVPRKLEDPDRRSGLERRVNLDRRDGITIGPVVKERRADFV